MATKEDILEQVAEEYLTHKGYFVRHNIKYLPRKDHAAFISNKDSNHSDIDVIGIHPRQEGHKKVVAVSCKSWQDGFNPSKLLQAINSSKKLSGREAWKGFRELTNPKWSEAFVTAIEHATGSRQFTYVLAVAHVKGDKSLWENHPPFLDAIGKNPIRVITFDEMVTEIDGMLTRTVASTDVGRMLQMFKFSDRGKAKLRAG